MESVDDVMLDSEDRMDKAIQFLSNELSGVRTGKASPSLVENVPVEYYGTEQRIRDIANISTPEPRLIVINPFDPSSIGAIEKAIMAANVGVTPMNDGRVIRVPIPDLSEERRKDLVKLAKRISEEQRVAIRNVRREANDHLKALHKDSKITEDDRDGGLEDVQKLTDGHIKKADDMLAAKEADITSV